MVNYNYYNIRCKVLSKFRFGNLFIVLNNRTNKVRQSEDFFKRHYGQSNAFTKKQNRFIVFIVVPLYCFKCYFNVHHFLLFYFSVCDLQTLVLLK